MKPTPQMAEQYCAALMAWTEGKRVEFRISRPSTVWTSIRDRADFPSIANEYEFRIIDEPPKLREVFVAYDSAGNRGGTWGVKPAYHYDTHETIVTFREVSAAADAEIAELRRNHDAMKAAIEKHRENYATSDLFKFLRDERAKL